MPDPARQYDVFAALCDEDVPLVDVLGDTPPPKTPIGNKPLTGSAVTLPVDHGRKTGRGERRKRDS